MRVNTIPRTIAAVALTSAIALTGCSGKTEPTPEEEAMGPLDKYFQVFWGDEEWDEETAKQEEAARQELIAQCMTDLGWEYIPVPWQEGGYVTYDSEEEEGPMWGTLEFAKQYGYGIVSWPGQDEEPTEEPTGGEWVDPNQEYVDSLSESEQEAYWIDLYGNWDGWGEELDEDGNPIEPDIDWSQMGCDGKARADQQGEQPYEDPEFTELFERMNEVYATWENNSDMAALEQEWASCMSGKGFTFASRDEAMNDMYEQSNKLWENVDWEKQPDGPAQADLDAFQKIEIEQATVDFQCAEDINYNDRQQEINFALQQKFVDENRAELDALVAKHGKK